MTSPRHNYGRSLDLTAVSNHDGAQRLICRIGTSMLNLANYLHTLDDLTENDVLAIQVRSRHRCNKELRAIGVSSSIRHGKKTRLVVLVDKVLVVELLSINRLTTSSISTSEISSLNHEVRDHTVEGAALVMQRLSSLSLSLLSSAKRSTVNLSLRKLPEILRRLGSILK